MLTVTLFHLSYVARRGCTLAPQGEEAMPLCLRCVVRAPASPPCWQQIMRAQRGARHDSSCQKPAVHFNS